MSTKRRVSYFYDSEVGNYHYGQGHPMKVKIQFILIYKTLSHCYYHYIHYIIEFNLIATSCTYNS